MCPYRGLAPNPAASVIAPPAFRKDLRSILSPRVQAIVTKQKSPIPLTRDQAGEEDCD